MQRAIIRVSGPDASGFLQGLVTNDLRALPQAGILYAALLSPQGKYLADFFLVADGEDILIDVAESLAEDVLRRLSLYKLRSAVTVMREELPVSRGTGPTPEGALVDPRHPTLGWRLYGVALPEDGTDWAALRVAYCIPETGIELIPDETFILEAGLDRLNGVDFRKGCYVGQEVTARMHHKTELRKGFVTVDISGPAEQGAEILAGGKPAGQVFTRSGDRAIAYLRFDRAGDAMMAGEAKVIWHPAREAG
ncbi:MAG: folate-binding protein YgfZ [Natronohydrobacter sp.]|nr:folate-binding protein YgfZ [Natronohydrobacter sp.]